MPHPYQAMRVCPTVDGSSPPLITHRIGAADCLSRQRCNYHKCHRCIYRGKDGLWVPSWIGQNGEPRPTVAARGVPTKTLPAKPGPEQTVELQPEQRQARKKKRAGRGSLPAPA